MLEFLKLPHATRAFLQEGFDQMGASRPIVQYLGWPWTMGLSAVPAPTHSADSPVEGAFVVLCAIVGFIVETVIEAMATRTATKCRALTDNRQRNRLLRAPLEMPNALNRIKTKVEKLINAILPLGCRLAIF
jgi:hypothetical protein